MIGHLSTDSLPKMARLCMDAGRSGQDDVEVSAAGSWEPVATRLHPEFRHKGNATHVISHVLKHMMQVPDRNRLRVSAASAEPF